MSATISSQCIMWEWWEVESRPLSSRVQDANAKWYNFCHRCIVTRQMIDNCGVSLTKVQWWPISLCTKSQSFLEVATCPNMKLWNMTTKLLWENFCSRCSMYKLMLPLSRPAYLFCLKSLCSAYRLACPSCRLLHVTSLIGYTLDWDGHGRLVGSPFPVDHSSVELAVM